MRHNYCVHESKISGARIKDQSKVSDGHDQSTLFDRQQLITC